jgi:hypothetical protein
VSPRGAGYTRPVAAPIALRARRDSTTIFPGAAPWWHQATTRNGTALLNEIQAWREAREAQAEGSPWCKMFQNKMKRAEWKLQALGPSQDSPGTQHRKSIGQEIGARTWARPRHRKTRRG